MCGVKFDSADYQMKLVDQEFVGEDGESVLLFCVPTGRSRLFQCSRSVVEFQRNTVAEINGTSHLSLCSNGTGVPELEGLEVETGGDDLPELEGLEGETGGDDLAVDDAA